MYVFKGQLYLKVVDLDDLSAQIMRTRDTKHWELVATEERAEDYWTMFMGFTSFQGALYLVNVKGAEEGMVARLWRSSIR